jgi:maltose alpha-D-glucosyltransferase/alpha-amylase
VRADLEHGHTLAHLLGQRTAEMHLTLAADVTSPTFAPIPFTPFYQRALYQAARSLVGRVLVTLQQQPPRLPSAVQEDACHLLAQREALLQRFRQVTQQPIAAKRLRCHGDYHLGQVLATGTDLCIFDFEGQPQHLVSERQLKHSPLRDVASMLWSFQEATARARFHGSAGDARAWGEAKRLAAWAQLWYGCTGHAFLRTYLATASPGTFLPQTHEDLLIVLEHYLLATGVATLSETLATCPQRAWVALDGLRHLLEAPSTFAP